MPTTVDVLIPTYRRPAALAVTLAGLAAQEFGDLRVIVSDQTPDDDPPSAGEVRAILGVLRARGIAAEVHKHLPRRGMAEHRQFLLDRVMAPYALFLDDDVYLRPDVVGRMVGVLRREGCGFVGCGLIGPSFLGDVRPHEQAIEFWDGPVEPEEVRPGTPQWNRHRLHSAANLDHLQRRLGLTGASQRTYKVAWVGGCVLYSAAKLRAVGGFGFWGELPEDHCGEDVLAQLRVMRHHGGCGLIPSGAYHLDLPTTLADRRADAPQILRGGGAAEPRVTVVMPVLDPVAPIRRAIESLRAGALASWELVVVDGTDAGEACRPLAPYLDDARVRYYRQGRGRGLAAALNEGLDRARAPLVAYLPPGGRFDPEHIATLTAIFADQPDVILAYSELHHGGETPRSWTQAAPPFRLVQLLHRRTDDRWPRSPVMTAEEAARWLSARLRGRGAFLGSARVTCSLSGDPATAAGATRPAAALTPREGYRNGRRIDAGMEPIGSPRAGHGEARA